MRRICAHQAWQFYAQLCAKEFMGGPATQLFCPSDSTQFCAKEFMGGPVRILSTNVYAHTHVSKSIERGATNNIRMGETLELSPPNKDKEHNHVGFKHFSVESLANRKTDRANAIHGVRASGSSLARSMDWTRSRSGTRNPRCVACKVC